MAVLSAVGGSGRADARTFVGSPGSWLTLAAGIVMWEIAGRLSDVAFLPPFSAALTALWRMTLSGEIPRNIVASLTALVIGYVFAVVVGVPLGVLMGRYRRVDVFTDLYVTLLLATPSILFVPILFSLFGTTRLTQVTFTCLSSLGIIAVNARSGIRMVDASYVEMARSFGATERQVVARILLPGALPFIMAGLRIGLGRGVRAMINGEMLIVVVGLGALQRRYGARFDAASVYALLLVVVGIGLICTATIQWVERRMTRWAD
jgi:NitT/TauT family transport system permease protein